MGITDHNEVHCVYFRCLRVDSFMCITATVKIFWCRYNWWLYVFSFDNFGSFKVILRTFVWSQLHFIPDPDYHNPCPNKDCSDKPCIQRDCTRSCYMQGYKKGVCGDNKCDCMDERPGFFDGVWNVTTALHLLDTFFWIYCNHLIVRYLNKIRIFDTIKYVDFFFEEETANGLSNDPLWNCTNYNETWIAAAIVFVECEINF